MKTFKIIFGLITLIAIGFNYVPVEYHSVFTDFIFGGGITMATIYTPGCGTPPPPTCQDCPVVELGGVRSIWLQKNTFTFTDITNPIEWDTNICNGNVVVFPFTNGTVAQDANMEDGFGNTPTSLSAFTYTVDFVEPQHVNNIPFWNFVKSGNSYLLGYKTQNYVYLSQVAAQFTPTQPISKDLKSTVRNHVKATFVQANLIQEVNIGAAQAIFTTCTDC